ncbi:MAG: DUF1549 domain-containing protein, partial [Planctomycetes bacterium]|nr:DUF1549 domain-containing protein [Planctomycetota bacterium]
MKRIFSAVFTSLLLVTSAWAQTHPAQVARDADKLLNEEIGLAKDATPSVDDETFLRRVSLDLLGEIPTRDDVLAFLLDDDPNKRSKVVNMFLKEDAYGANWGRYWRDVIMYRKTEQRSGLAARPLETYLADAFNKNTRWDDLATSLVTASGDVRENGATGLIMAQGGRPEETVAEISRIFMGIQIQCAQCHDHPYDRWERDQFHELAAFFPRVAIRPNGQQGKDRSFLVYASDFQPRFRRNNGNNRYRGTLEHRMPDLENPTSQGKLMQPVFFATGQKLKAGVKDNERRETLARWMTARSNPWFAKALVNRMWAELCGEGFYEPVDD